MAKLTAQTHSHLGIGMRKKGEWTKGRAERETEFGQDAGSLGGEAIFVKFQTCWHHVTFDLSPVWQKKRFVQNVYRRTDRRTTNIARWH